MKLSSVFAQSTCRLQLPQKHFRVAWLLKRTQDLSDSSRREIIAPFKQKLHWWGEKAKRRRWRWQEQRRVRKGARRAHTACLPACSHSPKLTHTKEVLSGLWGVSAVRATQAHERAQCDDERESDRAIEQSSDLCEAISTVSLRFVLQAALSVISTVCRESRRCGAPVWSTHLFVYTQVHKSSAWSSCCL